MPTMNSSMPPWSVEYDYSIDPGVVRTDGRASTQRKASHRRVMLGNATRVLQFSQLPYFEYFIRELCNDGADKFTDVYADYNGLVTGSIRLYNGSYSVQTNTRRHIVTCQIEIFR